MLLNFPLLCFVLTQNFGQQSTSWYFLMIEDLHEPDHLKGVLESHCGSNSPFNNILDYFPEITVKLVRNENVYRKWPHLQKQVYLLMINKTHHLSSFYYIQFSEIKYNHILSKHHECLFCIIFNISSCQNSVIKQYLPITASSSSWHPPFCSVFLWVWWSYMKVIIVES